MQNGLRALYIPVDDAVSHVQIDVLSGSDNETDSHALETAHFLEHMNGQLTSSDQPNALKISRRLEGRGVRWNAFVTPYRTGYFLTGPSTSFALMLDVLLSTFFSFKLDASVFEQERHAVVQELKRHRSSKWYRLLQTHRKVLYPGHPRSASIDARLRNVKKLTTGDLLKFRRKFYVAENILVTVAHRAEERDRVLAVLADRSGVSQRRPATSFPRLEPRDDQGVTIAYSPYPGALTTRALISFRVPYSYFEDNQKYSLLALSMLLTGGFSSRLYRRLRSVEGLVYSISSSPYLDFHDAALSMFTIETSSDTDDVAKVIAIVLHEAFRLARPGDISDAELEKYRNQVAFRFDELRLNRHPRKRVGLYTETAVWRRAVVTEDEHRENALSISRENIEGVARVVFSPHLASVIVTYGGPRNLNDTIRQILHET